jgi:hypothetical protein
MRWARLGLGLVSRGTRTCVDDSTDLLTMGRSRGCGPCRGPRPTRRVESAHNSVRHRRYTHCVSSDTSRFVLQLREHGPRLISRSKAKSLVADLDRFREVIFDFSGITGVGQGFVDQIFRVWARAHPEVKLVPREMCPNVEFMVRRGTPRGPVGAGGR